MKVLKKTKDKIREKVQDFLKFFYNFLIILDISFMFAYFMKT